MTNPVLLTSYMKSILDQSNCVSQIILDRTLSFKEKQLKIADQPQQTLQQKNIENILFGPFQPFIKRIFHALSTLAHLRQQTSVHNETIFKQDEEDKNSIPIDKLQKLSHTDSERVHESLINAIRQHNKDLSEKITCWLDLINKSLAKEGLTLSENEETELNKLYPINELLAVLSDLKIEHPGLKKVHHYDFKHYMKLKCRYAIYNCLNKKQEPCDEPSMKLYLKKIKHALETVHKQEVAFLKDIQKKYSEILSQVKFAKIHK